MRCFLLHSEAYNCLHLKKCSDSSFLSQYFPLVFQIVGDITKASTLTPENFRGVRKVINAVSVIVGPKEGDTPDRAKYSQVNLCL